MTDLTTRINNARRGQNDAQRSADLAILARDALTWNDQLANLSSPWTTAGTAAAPTVTGGKAFMGTVVGAALRPVTVPAGSRFRYLCRIAYKDGQAAGRVSGVIATTASASSLASGGGTSATVGVWIDQAASGGAFGARHVFAQAFGSNVDLGVLPTGDKDLLMGMFLDETRGLGLFCRAVDGTFEGHAFVAPSVLLAAGGGSVAWVPTGVGFMGTDGRGSSTGTGFGPLGYRAATATIDPRTGVEGVTQSIHSGVLASGSTGESNRIAIPATYDSRQKVPLFIYCHGGLGTAVDALALAPFSANGYIVASGDFRSADGGLAAMGSQASIDKVVDLYTWVRDRYNVGPVFIGGYSMGGLTSARVVADGRVPNIAGIVSSNSPFDMDWVWTMRADSHWSANWAAIKAAWSVGDDTRATWNAATNPYSPILFAAEAFLGTPWLMWSSSSDQTAIQAPNTIAMRDKLIAADSPVTWYANTGDHGDVSGWPTATILAWMNALAYS